MQLVGGGRRRHHTAQARDPPSLAIQNARGKQEADLDRQKDIEYIIGMDEEYGVNL